jgi:acetolactate synthase-1/2/3 large subunit
VTGPSTGAALVVEALVQAGVPHLFSLSGNQILSIYDATIAGGPAIVHTRHEAAAVHMADAWGRLTGQPGVALVTAGPGHLNAVSALYGALMAESPMVLLSGHSPLGQIGCGAFQEVDQVAAARPVTKAAWVARSAATLGADIATALAVAVSGRPGPVHVSLPGDLLEARVDAPEPAASAPSAVAPLGRSEIEEILEALGAARRPLILLGPAMARPPRRASADALAAVTGIPALPVESPRGVNDPWLHAGVGALAEADVVLLLGKRLDFSLRFGQPPAFAPGCRFVRVDVDAGAQGVIRDAAHVADPVLAARALAEAGRARAWAHRGWGEEVARARAAEPGGWADLRRSDRAPVHPLRVCAALQPYLNEDAVLVCDGGEFGQWVQAGTEARIRLINGLSGSIGSALPMAVAARLALPDRTVIAALGDGTFGFHPFELDTALRHGLPVVAVVGNDARWNAEHQLQIQQYGASRTVGCELLPTRCDEIARALGGHGEYVERPDEIDAAIGRAVKSARPACVNVTIDGQPAPTYRSAARSH